MGRFPCPADTHCFPIPRPASVVLAYGYRHDGVKRETGWNCNMAMAGYPAPAKTLCFPTLRPASCSTVWFTLMRSQMAGSKWPWTYSFVSAFKNVTYTFHVYVTFSWGYVTSACWRGVPHHTYGLIWFLEWGGSGGYMLHLLGGDPPAMIAI